MHSSLQSEFRLIQKLVRNPCQRSRQRCESPRRSFHQNRHLRTPQGARNDGSSQPSSPPPTSDDQTNPKQPPIAPSVPYSLNAFPSPAAVSAAQGGHPPDDPASSQSNGFHGSLRNRAMRARASKESRKLPIDIPDWLMDGSVTLLGEGPLGPDATTSIEYMPHMMTSERSRATRRTKNETHGIHGAGQSHGTESNSSAGGDIPDEGEPSATSEQDSSSRTDRRRKPGKELRYKIGSLQHIETQMTVRGLILPSRKPEYDSEPANRTAHLILRYAAPDAQMLLDEYVTDLAFITGCDLMTLDVQDIAEMIATSHQPSDIIAEARHMSHDVLRDPEDDRDTGYGSSIFEEGDEDMEDEGDSFENSPMGGGPRMPIMMGKPIAIDLSNIANIFGGKLTSRSPDLKPFRRRGLTTGTTDKSQPPTTAFTDLVERLLSAMAEKRQKASLAAGAQKPLSNAKSPNATTQTMLHIKDVKAIQDTPVGGQFLSELYSQVERRRNNGELIILIGTECSTPEEVSFAPLRIEDMQILKNYEISRTIVLTPIANDTAARLNLKQDARQRIATINMRHIFQTMWLKQANVRWSGLTPGFWRTDQWLGRPKHIWASTDLGKKVLSFSDVHRIATMLVGLGSGPYETNAKVNTTELAIDLDAINALLRDSDSSKDKWAKSQLGSRRLNINFSIPTEDSTIAKVRSTASKHEKKLLSGVIEPSKITTTFADVHAPVETIDALQTLTTLSLIRPEAFSYGVLASDKIPGLLLYGPPGTGKTLLAKAVAKESGARVLEVSAADINDMYVGEGEKNVKALFSLAKKLSPCVVFLDEADAMFSARANSGKRVSHRELLNQFLKEWDGMSNDSGSAFIMVATNRPMDLDDAVLRRLPRRLLVDLPTEQDRHEILKIHLRSEQLAEDVNLDDLAKNTPFYSGSDLKNLAVAAALNAVKEENQAAKQHKIRQEESKHQTSGEKAEEPSPTAYQYPEKRTLTAKHFETALEEITASISEDMSSLKDIKKFDEQYGDKRGKRKKKPMWGFKSAIEADKVLDTVKVRNA